jgi:flagellar hook-basal body protein
MTISSSLNAGVAGLNGNASKLATIADNIANASTYGYKRAVADFHSLVLSEGSGSYSAGGVRVTTNRLIDERGPLVTTNNATDLAVSGAGMLPTTMLSALDNQTASFPLSLMTTGSFRPNAEGVLMGWPAETDGSVGTYPRDTVDGLEPVRVNLNQFAGDPTTKIELSINLPATATEAGILDLTLAGGPVTVKIGALSDPNGLTQLSDSFAPVSIIKDGSPVGNLSGVEVDANGYMHAIYDIGFTRTIYQIPLVDVPNPNGLIALNNQAYQVSPESGSFFLWDAGAGPTGDVVGYAREESATDVAGELTRLITTQRAYSSNAKVIQTVDEMLQETTNMKR